MQPENILYKSSSSPVAAPTLLIPQISSQFLLCPAEGSADGAFVHAPLTRDLGDGLLLEVVGGEGLPLQFRQFLPDHPLDPLELHIPGQPGT